MKKLILIRGPIYSGKSTTARLLRERLGEASAVDFDVFKRQIDDTKSTPWRSELAFKASLFLADRLMKFGRTIIADIHSSQEYQYREYQKLATESGYILFSFLLKPPLKTCLERSRTRDDSNLKYKISDEKITNYWRNTFHVPHEPVFDSSKLSPEEIVLRIMEIIQP